jgi:hypothetical protein
LSSGTNLTAPSAGFHCLSERSFDGYAVPPPLRGARFIPRASATSRAYLNLPQPDGSFVSAWRAGQAHQWWPWTPEGDAYVRAYGAQMTGGGIVALDADVTLLPDGSVWHDGLRWLADAAAVRGLLLDVSGWLSVRTPGHQRPGKVPHGPGWHFAFADDPAWPVRTGALEHCAELEMKALVTCPGSPGYVIRNVPPDGLPVLPRWIAEMFGRAEPGRVTTGYLGASDLSEGQRAWLEYLKAGRPGGGAA